MSEPDRHVSVTQITTYLQCPRKYSYRYIEKLPPAWKSAALAFGSAVHSALEAFHDKLHDGETLLPDEVASVFRSDFAAAQVDDLRFKDGEDGNTLGEMGEALVRLYVSENQNIVVRHAERPFEAALTDPETGEILGPPLRGVFDLVLDGDVLVEIKTAARSYDEDTLARHLQLSAYAWSYREIFGRDPTIQVIALMKYKRPKIVRHEVTRTKDDDVRFVHLASEVAASIEAGFFPPNPGWQCADCEYQEPCATWRRPNRTVADNRRHLTVITEEEVRL